MPVSSRWLAVWFRRSTVTAMYTPMPATSMATVINTRVIAKVWSKVVNATSRTAPWLRNSRPGNCVCRAACAASGSRPS